MSSFNKDPVSNIVNDCLEIIDLCLMHKNVYKNDKSEMMKIIERQKPFFYHEYYRVCVTLVGYQIEENLDKMLYMLEKMYDVQEGELTKEEFSDMMTNGLNTAYFDPVLNSKKLIKERRKKGYKS